MIKITDKYELAKVLFVLNAAVEQKEKFGNAAMKCVLIDADGTMVCTDGRRMHTCKTEYAPGMYDIIKKTRGEVVLAPSTIERAQFPDYARCIPRIDGREPTIEVEPGAPICKTYTKLNRATQETTLDYRYFTEALSETDSIYWRAPLEPVVFTGNGTVAVVMPFRI